MRAPMHNFILLSLSFFALTTSFPSTSSFSLTTKPHYPRRILHQPLFPLTSALPPETVPLSPPPPLGSDKDEPFNPEVPAATLANGSIPVPAATQPVKKVAIAISVGIVTLGMLSALAFFLYRHRVKSTGEGKKLFDGEDSRAPPSTFLYIGTVEPSRSSVAESNQTNGSPYHKLNSIKRSADRYRPSPDLQPLPPLSSPPAPGSSSDDESRGRNGVNTIDNVPPSKRTSPKSRFSSSSSAASSEMKLVITPPMCKPPPPPLPRARTESAICTDDKDGGKPKLKPLHWDKVRATSDRATVWDQIKSSSFELNEDKMESLFGCNSTNSANRDPRRRSVLPPVESKNRALDLKKSQNIAILLKALNVTADEVSEALLDGNPESLGVELLETLVKMAPTKEEEIKLRDYHGDVSKLGSAERFLKAVLDVPFAFKRVEAMLYRANFDTEVAYLRRSFQTLEEASEELKNSKLFPKLFEAVLSTGNRTNVGTNRGDAKAFRLETLLKLIDIKGTDGKTTVLHFVVQEIIRSEGLSGDSKIENLEPITQTRMKEEDFRKQGLQVVSGLSRDLSNVKKAAGMDSDVLLSYVSKLESGLEKVRLVLQNEQPDTQGMFFKSKKMFVREADEEINSLKMDERKALALVKEVTEYFHGDTAKEGAQPFRIFMIVRDLLNILDHVCKDVGMMQDRMVVGAARSFRISATASLPVLNRYNAAQNRSSDEEIT